MKEDLGAVVTDIRAGDLAVKHHEFIHEAIAFERCAIGPIAAKAAGSINMHVTGAVVERGIVAQEPLFTPL